MAHQLSRPALAMRGRRGLWSLCLRYSSIARTTSNGPGADCPHPNPPPAKPGEGTYCTTPSGTRCCTPLPPTPLGEGWDGGHQRPEVSRTPASISVLAALALMLVFPPVVLGQVKDGVPPPKHKWTKFVTVAGQPEPVPAEWVSTPEGQFAHSIVLPNPVPKDSGYRWWWSAKKYFLHLCEKEAGEFVFKTVDNVEGFLFMRPPNWPTDFDLKDRYKLEAPDFERSFQAYRDDIRSRGRHYSSPGRRYRYVEEPDLSSTATPKPYLRASSYDRKTFELTRVEKLEVTSSRYAMTWRGLRRPSDRENGIAGAEVLIVDLVSHEVMAVWRDFGLTRSKGFFDDDVWWLNAAVCPQFYSRYSRPDLEQRYGFLSSVLRPPSSATDEEK